MNAAIVYFVRSAEAGILLVQNACPPGQGHARSSITPALARGQRQVASPKFFGWDWWRRLEGAADGPGSYTTPWNPIAPPEKRLKHSAAGCILSSRAASTAVARPLGVTAELHPHMLFLPTEQPVKARYNHRCLFLTQPQQ